MNDKILNKDVTIRVLSVMLAILLWFYVITEQNPELTKDITVPVKLINAEYLDKNNMVLTGDTSAFLVTLRVKGNKNILDKLNEATVEAFADLEGHTSKGDNFLKINVNGIPEGVNLLWKSADSLKVFLEPKVNVQRSVEVNVMGNPSKGLAAMAPVIAPSDVVITGPESQVNKIKSVRVDVDIASVNTAVKKILPVRLLDESGKDVKNVKVDPSNVEVSIPIENTKRVSIQLDLTGQPAPEYTINSVSVLPGEILITGKQQVLDSINLLKTEKIDITGAVMDMDKEVTLVLPEGAELVNKDEKIRVFVDVERVVTKEITVGNIDYINLPDGMTVDSIQSNLRVVLKGAESLLNEAPGNMRFYVDLKHAVEGTNTLSIVWDKPQGVEVLDIAPQQATVVLKRG